MKRRVVITGMSGVSALGHTWKDIKEKMMNGKTGIVFMEDWTKIEGMQTNLAAPIIPLDIQDRYPRKKTRCMGSVSFYALYATEQALNDAGLLNDPILSSGRVGIAYGSSFGSTAPIGDFANLIFQKKLKNITATSYIRMMSHTAAVNVSLYFGLQGRLIPTSVACASGSLAIGYALEAIQSGAQDIMIAGGAEELCPSMAAVFDTLYATSTKNDTPHQSPRPFDDQRDGLVIGEGAATLILEEYEHAKKRGAKIYAEIIGFATNTDGQHVTQPSQETIVKVMEMALNSANLNPEDIDVINGHGTSTLFGDVIESHATYAVFSNRVPFHTQKAYFGHTLGACGALEAWLGIEMMQDKWLAPIVNLENVDPKCAPLNYITKEPLQKNIQYFMSNNFAFGGINTSLIFKKF
ncbi:MAG: 3-oxoacyl-[acyl-carrier-protein] synthase 1 [Holosporales bacterium]